MVTSLWETEGIVFRFPQFHKPVLLIRQAGFLTGPLFFFLFRKIIYADIGFSWKDTVHFLPFLLSLLFCSFYLSKAGDFIIWESGIYVAFTGLMLLHNLLYFIFSVRIYYTSKSRFKLDKADNGKYKRFWILLILGGSIAIWIIQLQSLILLNIFNFYKYCRYMSSLYSAVTFLFFTIVLYSVLCKPEIFSRLEKYRQSRLTAAEKDRYRKKLTDYLAAE